MPRGAGEGTLPGPGPGARSWPRCPAAARHHRRWPLGGGRGVSGRRREGETGRFAEKLTRLHPGAEPPPRPRGVLGTRRAQPGRG